MAVEEVAIEGEIDGKRFGVTASFRVGRNSLGVERSDFTDVELERFEVSEWNGTREIWETLEADSARAIFKTVEFRLEELAMAQYLDSGE